MEKHDNLGFTEQPLPSNHFTLAETYPSDPPTFPTAPQPAEMYPCVPIEPSTFIRPTPIAPPTGACIIINSTGQKKYNMLVTKEQAHIRCPSCNQEVITTIESEADNRTHLWVIALCILGCWPFCFLPYCMDSCKTINHTCPVCNALVGSRKD